MIADALTRPFSSFFLFARLLRLLRLPLHRARPLPLAAHQLLPTHRAPLPLPLLLRHRLLLHHAPLLLLTLPRPALRQKLPSLAPPSQSVSTILVIDSRSRDQLVDLAILLSTPSMSSTPARSSASASRAAASQASVSSSSRSHSRHMASLSSASRASASHASVSRASVASVSRASVASASRSEAVSVGVVVVAALDFVMKEPSDPERWLRARSVICMHARSHRSLGKRLSSRRRTSTDRPPPA